MLFGRFCERAYLYGTFGKPGRNWLHCQTNSILIRLYEICQCELDSWTCHPTNFGLIGHMQEKNRGGGAKLSMLAYVGCWSHCGSWSLSYTVVLSCVMEKTVCYHVLPVLTSRSCRSQEIIRGAIHWLRRVCVCVAIDGMHRIAIFNIHLYICMPCLMFMCICLLFDLFVYMRVRSEQPNNWSSMIPWSWIEDRALQIRISCRNSQYFRLDTFTTTGRVSELNLGKKQTPEQTSVAICLFAIDC